MNPGAEHPLPKRCEQLPTLSSPNLGSGPPTAIISPRFLTCRFSGSLVGPWLHAVLTPCHVSSGAGWQPPMA